jgi:hypothetical protein
MATETNSHVSTSRLAQDSERCTLANTPIDMAIMVAHHNPDQPQRVHDNGQFLRSMRLATAGYFRSGLPRHYHR